MDATHVIDTLTLDSTIWNALTPVEQENYLRIAYRIFVDGINKVTHPLPLVMPVCAGESQALMAVHDVRYSLSASTVTAATGAIKKQQVGQLVQEFYEPTTGLSSTSVGRIPTMASACLEHLGYSLKTKTAGLKQTILGRA